MTGSSLFDEGMTIRREVLGADYVDASVAAADDFMMTMQRATTELCWGYVWRRQGLERKVRSMINLSMLTALGRSAELKLHVRGALRNGVSVEEIREILLHATIYCGVPAGLEAFRAAHEVLIAEGVIGAEEQ